MKNWASSMRPVRRGASPIAVDYSDYADAKTDLISRIGSGWAFDLQVAAYCSYCERPIVTMLAVEHIEPKGGLFGKPHLIGKWSNFLLACVNCNSVKKDKQVILADIFIPDRDNTFAAFDYLPDGNIVPAADLSPADQQRAKATLELTGLDRAMRQTHDLQGRVIAEDRASQRLQAWGLADSLKAVIDAYPDSEGLRTSVVTNALTNGFFSIWMRVFDDDEDMKRRLVLAFSGTEGSGCFDLDANVLVRPGPNADRLDFGGKV